MTELRSALRWLPVPDHGPGFWDRLEAELADDPYVQPKGPHRARRWSAALLVAAVVALAAVGLGRGATNDRAASDDGPATRVTSTTVPAAWHGALTAADEFLAAVAAGDHARMAALAGPRSDAYAATTPLAELAAAATEELGWAAAPGVTRKLVPTKDPAAFVVLLRRGERLAALPVWHGVVDGTWAVEPWAFDPDGSRILMVTPDASARPIVLASGDPILLSLPVPGHVLAGHEDGLWLAFQSADTAPRWGPMRTGKQLAIVAEVTADLFVASAWAIDIDPEPDTYLGAYNRFRYTWQDHDEKGMHQYGTDEAVRQARAIPTESWRAAQQTGCVGTVGDHRCTLRKASGQRLVFRIRGSERPIRVEDVHLEPPDTATTQR